MALTTSGLLVDRAQRLVHLHAETGDWEKVREVWHAERLGARGTRESSQKIFKLLRDRLQAAGSKLPRPDDLARLLHRVANATEAAQVLFLYTVEEDALLRYVVHELLRSQELEAGPWDVSQERIQRLLHDFRYADGAGLDYSEATLERWAQGARSVLADIGVRRSPTANEGNPPALGRMPLLVGAYYSWATLQAEWETRPIGWAYLFQPPSSWPVLTKRLYDEPGWHLQTVGRTEILQPRDDPFDIQQGGPR